MAFFIIYRKRDNCQALLRLRSQKVAYFLLRKEESAGSFGIVTFWGVGCLVGGDGRTDEVCLTAAGDDTRSSKRAELGAQTLDLETVQFDAGLESLEDLIIELRATIIDEIHPHHYTPYAVALAMCGGRLTRGRIVDNSNAQTRKEATMVDIVGDRTVLRGLLNERSFAKARRYVLVVPSGSKAGYVSAILLRELARRGMKPEQFKVVVATSAGFLNAMAFCAGQQEVTPEVYLHLAGKPWFFPAGIHTRWVTFYDYLLSILRGEVFDNLRLDLNALGRCPARKLVAVSDLSGSIRYHELKDPREVFAFMHGAAAILPFSLGAQIEGKTWIDGAYAHAHCQFARIVRELMHEDRTADVCVLFLGNRPRITHQHWIESWAYGVGMCASLWWSPQLLMSALALDRKIEQSERLFRRAWRKRTHLCAIFPNQAEKIDPWEWRPALMEAQGKKVAESLSRELLCLR